MDAKPTEFQQIQRSKPYTAIVDQVLDRIRTGLFPPGAALPAERLLAEQFGVSRATLREAIRVLEHAGVLEVRGGSGTYVADSSQSNGTLIGVRAHIVGDHSPLDILVARRELEPACARLAAEAASEEDISALEEALELQEWDTYEGRDPAASDIAFHIAVARASGNSALLRLQETLVEFIHEDTWNHFKSQIRSSHETAQGFVEEHRGVLKAIASRDRDAASQTMLAHLDSIEHAFLKHGRGDITGEAR